MAGFRFVMAKRVEVHVLDFVVVSWSVNVKGEGRRAKGEGFEQGLWASEFRFRTSDDAMARAVDLATGRRVKT